MINATDGYKAAIVGDVRRMFIKAMLEIIDPDIQYGASNGSDLAPWAKIEQLGDRVTDVSAKYATLEPGRWVLDGSFPLIPDDPTKMPGDVAYVGDVLSGEDGTFPTEVYAEVTFSNVSILQACSVFFSTNEPDGVPEDFIVSIMSNGEPIYNQLFVGNKATKVEVTGFTVCDPTAVRITISKWSLAGRRARIAEIIPGLYEEWTEDMLASLDIQMRGNFACLAIPYGVCTLRMDNLDRRFEPRNKSGVFQSIEDRQAIPVTLGVQLEDGSTEWKKAGVFYQANGGWKTGNNDITMQWDLVDIVGLVAQREFIAPATLPTTLGGWLAAIVAQLGANFASKWHVDPAYENIAVTANSAEDVNGKKCGDILRFACMASGTWPRADAETGYLTAEPFWNQGNKLDLDNMSIYPIMKANDDLAALIFKLYDGSDTTYVVSGNSTSSSETLTISNPFIHTEAQALTAAKQILSQYGGMKLETIGRGDPSSEIGDVDTVWLDESSATTGRRMEQSFSFSGGVLKDCKSVLLQADGSFMFESSALIKSSGQWTPPAGVTQLRLIIGQGGQGGSAGADGGMATIVKSHESLSPDQPMVRDSGAIGSGGKIWTGVVNVNAGQAIDVYIGKGGKATAYGVPGEMGEESTFGVYSSANGKVYSPSYTDIASGNSYGRSGVLKPLAGSSDGGAQGEGGIDGTRSFSHREPIYNDKGEETGFRNVYVENSSPTKGKPGVNGASGFVLIYWDKEAEA